MSYSTQYYSEHKSERKVYVQAYRKRNRETVLERQRKYEREHADERAAYEVKYREIHSQQVKDLAAKDYQKNKSRYNAQRREKYANNEKFKILGLLRARLSAALKAKDRVASAKELVGCSIEFLKQYIELLFEPGMNWSNHGKWHIDHIVPCNTFNLLDPVEQSICFHYSNLQPLWAIDNLKKGRKAA